jgi:hypothetical protein
VIVPLQTTHRLAESNGGDWVPYFQKVFKTAAPADSSVSLVAKLFNGIVDNVLE